MLKPAYDPCVIDWRQLHKSLFHLPSGTTGGTGIFENWVRRFAGLRHASTLSGRRAGREGPACALPGLLVATYEPELQRFLDKATQAARAAITERYAREGKLAAFCTVTIAAQSI